MTMHYWTFFPILTGLMVYTGVHARRLLPMHPLRAWLLTGLLFAFMMSWSANRRGTWGPGHRFWFNLLAWSGSITLGAWSTFILLAMPADLVRIAYQGYQWLARRPFPPPAAVAPHASWVTITLIVLSMVMSGLGLIQALAGPRIKEVTVPVENLAPDLEGLRIVLLSDLHVSPITRRGFAESVVAKVAGVKPDLIAVTGDMAEGGGEALESRLRPLAQLRAPLGIYFVMGNHEVYRGAAEGLADAGSLGFIPLLNQNRVVTVGRAELLVGGVTDDSRSHGKSDLKGPDAMKAAFSKDPVQFKLLLAHRPEACFAAERAGFDLQLSGHTHGGQYFPWSLVIPFFHPYTKGLHRHGRMWIYVSVGTGYWGPPNRFLVPAEITLIRLTTLK